MDLDCHYRGPARQRQNSAPGDHVLSLDGRVQALERFLKQQVAVRGSDTFQPLVFTENSGLSSKLPENLQSTATRSYSQTCPQTDELYETADGGVDGLAITSFREEENLNYSGLFKTADCGQTSKKTNQGRPNIKPCFLHADCNSNWISCQEWMAHTASKWRTRRRRHFNLKANNAYMPIEDCVPRGEQAQIECLDITYS